MSLIEVMLFKLEDNGEIAAQKLFKILSGTHTVKASALKSWVPDIELARMETIKSIIPEISLLVQKLG